MAEAPAPQQPARRAFAALRRHPIRAFFGVALSAFLVLNVLAFRHAGALTRFEPAQGEGPGALEELSLAQRAQTLVGGPRLARPRNLTSPRDHGLPYTTHLLEGTSPRLELWHSEPANPRGVVLLCHGYGGSKSALLPAAAEFTRLGWACVLLDFRGSGGSEGNETSLGVREADDVARAVRFARGRDAGSRLVVFGTSMGAAAVLRSVYLGHIQPEGLILEAPFNRLLATVRHRFELLGVPSFPSAELLLFWGSVRAGIDGFEHDPARYARAVRCPTLVLHGDHDARVTVPEVEEVVAALPEPRSLVLLDGVGHEPYLAARPAEWRGAVEPFLAER